MSNYKKGYAQEKRIAQLLENSGYYVMTSRGSHGPFDLVAMNNVEVKAIQIKYNCYLSAEEREKIKETPSPHNCSKEVWRIIPHRSVKFFSVEVIE